MTDNLYGTAEVQITVVKVLESGETPCGYRPGDSWLVTGYRTPEGLCTWALNSMAPFLMTLRLGGSMPWENDKDVAMVTCPDAANPVVFELRRQASPRPAAT